MSARLNVWLMRQVLARLPLRVLRGLELIGRVLFVLAAPAQDSTTESGIVLSAGRCRTAQGVGARMFCRLLPNFFGSQLAVGRTAGELVLKRVQLQGALHELEGDTPTIIFAPHFYGMDAGGVTLPLHTRRAFTSIFSTHPNPAVDAWFMQGRQPLVMYACSTAPMASNPSLPICAKGACFICCPIWILARTNPSLCRFMGCRRPLCPRCHALPGWGAPRWWAWSHA